MGLGRVIWGRMVVWDRMGSFAIPHSLSKVFPHLPTPQAGPHPFAVTHSQRHGPHAHSRELDLSPEADKLPTQSGNKNAKSERRATVGDKERSEMGPDLGKQEMGHQGRASGMAAKEEQRWNRGIRDQARLGVTRRRQ